MRIEDQIHQTAFSDVYHKLVVNLLYTASWLNASNSKRLKPHDLSPQQYNILRILRGRYPSPATMGLVQSRMLDRESNASRLVDKLQKKGLLTRKPCRRDRRAVDILITEAGLEVVNAIDEEEGGWLRYFHSITEDEADTLNHLLDKLRSSKMA